ncbi:twin-arginine translocase TatA/TatE family subunit [uncultured Sphingomonas sp.]|uniref:twin-arginine translocase TatA/TatE family subunit n=1 Tax=uncultured Sphingomonas sp. TaxID=158754 RepID=UPI0035CC98F8
MGSFSLIHWLIFGVIAILVLGGGRFSSMMGDVAKGIKQFKKGMAEEDEAPKVVVREPGRLDTKPVVEPAYDPLAERTRETDR